MADDSNEVMDIFISYRRQRAEYALLLHYLLEKRGYKAFLDVKMLGVGEFPKQLKKAVYEAHYFLLVLYPKSLDRCFNKADWIRREIEYAFANKGSEIIPLRFDGFSFEDENHVKQELFNPAEVETDIFKCLKELASISVDVGCDIDTALEQIISRFGSP